MIDLFGHLSYAVLIVGTWFAAKGPRIGWYLRMAGDFGWIILGGFMGMTSIILWSLVFFWVDLVASTRHK